MGMRKQLANVQLHDILKTGRVTELIHVAHTKPAIYLVTKNNLFLLSAEIIIITLTI